ncbi:MAG: DUF924 family protein [Pseudomonadota bacterium]
MKSADVISFWFDECEPENWFKKDEVFDETIRKRFGSAHTRAAAGEFSDWRVSAEGRLAEVIVLDQFSRNLFRDRPESFAYDGIALVLAQEAISLGMDHDLTSTQRSFMYMPFMHSESLVIHDKAVELFTELGNELNLRFEHMHRDIIKKYGRYPHRNEILGRVSTADEVDFLAQPGSSF